MTSSFSTRKWIARRHVLFAVAYNLGNSKREHYTQKKCYSAGHCLCSVNMNIEHSPFRYSWHQFCDRVGLRMRVHWGSRRAARRTHAEAAWERNSGRRWLRCATSGRSGETRRPASGGSQRRFSNSSCAQAARPRSSSTRYSQRCLLKLPHTPFCKSDGHASTVNVRIYWDTHTATRQVHHH